MDDLRFDGRVAVITGAGRGMGRSHALYLAARGAKVVVNDLGSSVEGEGTNEEPAQRVVEEIRAAGGEAEANGDNVATTEGAEAIIATALEHFGSVDIVVNNAGIVRFSEFAKVDLDDFMRHLTVHLVGSFNVSRAAWPHMVASGYGRVVIVSSSAVLGMPDLVSYSAAKAGQIGLMKSLALAGSVHNIKVNAVAPIADTRMPARWGIQNVTPLGDKMIPMAPEYVSTLIAVLVHDSCPVSGEIIGAGSGRVARLFYGDTIGYTDRDMTPEDLLGHWEEVIDESDYSVPVDSPHHAERFRNPALVSRA